MSETLMRSVSGVRGIVGTDLTPEVVGRYAAAFGQVVARETGGTVVLGRDARESGPAFAKAAAEALRAAGVTVIDCGLVPTPTVQLAVEHHGASGGIIVTASHNPVEWNALKFVGPDGLFLDHPSVERLFAIVDRGARPPAAERRGGIRRDDEAVARHLEAVLVLDVVDVETIRARGFTVALDCVHGAGGIIMPALLERLGCKVVGLGLETDGRFPRPPEPLPQHLGELGAAVGEAGADVGMAVDPDVDRLAVVDERGRAIGEDYTLAFAVTAVLSRRSGPVVVNLSTSLVVDDAARDFGVDVTRAPVGEANVARAMCARGAVIGGEGNGGVMLPDLHLGRDAPVAAALILDMLARRGEAVSQLVASRPRYVIVKDRAPKGGALDAVYRALASRFADAEQDTEDGLRLEWRDRWLHVRPSGTEPIVRLIAEAPTDGAARGLIAEAKSVLAEHEAASCAE
jgi:phosphomannomutase